MSSPYKHTREWNGGKLTRPRHKWKGHHRNTARAQTASQMQASASRVLSLIGKVTPAFPRRTGG